MELKKLLESSKEEYIADDAWKSILRKGGFESADSFNNNNKKQTVHVANNNQTSSSTCSIL